MPEQLTLQNTQSSNIVRGFRDTISDRIKPLLNDHPFALLDFPDHSNVGDSAIWLGETQFFADHAKPPAYTSKLKSHDSCQMEQAIGDGTIFLHGGGNFGTIWKSHQDFRLKLLERFRDQPIVQLPQSIFFDNYDAVDETARAIEQHGNFTLLVRDQRSLEFSRCHFQCEVFLCPDMALYMEPLERLTPSHDFYYLMRTDFERSVRGKADHPGHSFESGDWLTEDKLQMRMTAATAKLMDFGHSPNAARVLKYDRLANTRLKRGIASLSSGRVVVTDRLHGHILSTLLGIPHVALDNSYGKLQNFIQAWTSEIGFLRTADTLEEAQALAEELLS
ncbi:polysaccharide pyruvyl transferase family protein [Parasphingorhabdus litoris]|uniref:Polysaccharide pyruvyl transferase family protein n=1 Tax=Parasphingorhabdus litoris TaxID=394733 RepID=A0ABN1AEC6_9SPHN|nr:polysaccharide pyruvyl transferase family protein [Parasphingorhabdus litoris]